MLSARTSPASTPNVAGWAPARKSWKRPKSAAIDTGLKVRHPFDTAWELPVYIANFILMDYGTGAIFGCPAHDQRDLDFARKYALPVIDTFVAAENGAPVEDEAFVPPKTEIVKWVRPFAWEEIASGEQAIDAAIGFCESEGRWIWRHQVPSARLGSEPPALLGLPDSGRTLRNLRRGAREERESAGPAAR